MRQKTQLACALIRPAAAARPRRAGRRARPALAGAAGRAAARGRPRPASAVLLTTHQLAFADGLADRAVMLAGGRRARPGPLGRRARAGPRAGLAVTPSRRPSACADVRRWWRAHGPRAAAGQRGSSRPTSSRSRGAIFGALVYSTAQQRARAGHHRARDARVWGPGLVLVGLVVVARWGAYQGPVVFSVADVGHTLGAPLPRRGLAVRPLARGLARGAVAGAVLAAVVLVGLERRRPRPRRRPRRRPRGRPGRRGRPRRRRGLGRAGVGPRRARRAPADLGGPRRPRSRPRRWPAPPPRRRRRRSCGRGRGAGPSGRSPLAAWPRRPGAARRS